MKIIRYILSFLLVVLLFFLILLIINPNLIYSIPEIYKSEEYLKILEKIVIPLGSILGIILLVLTYLIQLEEKKQKEKNLIHRELKISLHVFETRDEKDWIYALKIEFVNTSFSNIYLSRFFISYFLHSEPDKKELTFDCPMKMKLENGQIEEQVLKLSPFLSNEIENGYLVVKIKIIDSLCKEYVCDEIRLNEIQKRSSINLTLDKT